MSSFCESNPDSHPDSHPDAPQPSPSVHTKPPVSFLKIDTLSLQYPASSSPTVLLPAQHTPAPSQGVSCSRQTRRTRSQQNQGRSLTSWNTQKSRVYPKELTRAPLDPFGNVDDSAAQKYRACTYCHFRRWKCDKPPGNGRCKACKTDNILCVRPHVDEPAPAPEGTMASSSAADKFVVTPGIHSLPPVGIAPSTKLTPEPLSLVRIFMHYRPYPVPIKTFKHLKTIPDADAFVE
ncbi:hypothetical protein BDR22DRAFT_893156 [Usnea florida]